MSDAPQTPEKAPRPIPGIDPTLLPDLKELGATALDAALTQSLGTEVRTYNARWQQYAQEGVIVDLHLKRERFKLQLTLRDIGIEPEDTDEADRLNSILSLGHVFLLPKKLAVTAAERYDTRARDCLKKYSYKTYWGRWIPVQAFLVWRDADAAIQAEYEREVLDAIEAEYDLLKAQACVAWEGLCARAYDQLLATGASARIPSLGDDRAAWVAAQGQAFKARVPSMQAIRDKFDYAFEVWSMPSLVQQVRDEDAEARRVRMSDAERAMLDALEASATKRVAGGVDQFLTEVQGQIQREVVEVVSSALKTVARRGGKLGRNNSLALRELIAKYRAVVFWDDATTTLGINGLDRLLSLAPEKRDPRELADVLRTLGAEARLTLLDLDEPLSRDGADWSDEVGLGGDADELAEIARRGSASTPGDLFADDDDDDDLAPVAGRQDGGYDDDALSDLFGSADEPLPSRLAVGSAT